MKTLIAETGRMDMLYWARTQDSITADSVKEIRRLMSLDDCRTTACIGGLICYFATQEEIARANSIYDLSENEVQEPSLLSAAQLLSGAEDKYELEKACLPLLSLAHWPLEEQSAYANSKTDTERNLVILQRMDNWAGETVARQFKIPQPGGSRELSEPLVSRNSG